MVADWNHEERHRGTCINKDAAVGPMYLLVKDHKPTNRENLHPSRPLCLAKKSPNGVLSDLLSDLLDKISDSYNSEFECDSTEDMMRAITDSNKSIGTSKDLSIGGMDAG